MINVFKTSFQRLLSRRNYCGIEHFQKAPYVDLITSKLDISMLAKMRLSANNLEIERGRYLNIERERRLCQVCNANVIENEDNFLWDCMKYDKDRKIFIDKVSSHFNNFHLIPNDLKSAKLMNANSTKFVKMLIQWLGRGFSQMGHFQLFSMILKFSMGHFLSFYTDFNGPFSKLMGLWRMTPCLPNHCCYLGILLD